MTYPFVGIVGQDEMKLALILNVIDPSIGGVVLMGHRGTGKSTAVRALAELLPKIQVVSGCPYNCDPSEIRELCISCETALEGKKKLPHVLSTVPVVDLPLSATEDRVCGSIDIQRALSEGVKAFEPGLLARANRGFLYIDEVNLLADHLVDLLLDVAVTGRNKVERESISITHPAQFVLIGSGNPEEGELRPQLLDRFGLYVEVQTENDPEQRVEIVKRRQAFDQDPDAFQLAAISDQSELRDRVTRARKAFAKVKVDRKILMQIAMLCSALKVEGHRGELTIMRAARALSAFEGRKAIGEEDVRRVAPMSLRHRLRRDALEETGGTAAVEQALEQLFSKGSEPDRLQGGRADNDAGSSQAPQRGRDPGGNNGSDSRRELAPLPDREARLPKLKLSTAGELRSRSRSRQSGSRRPSQNFERGRFARAVTIRKAGASIAIVATLRALLNERGLKDDTACDLQRVPLRPTATVLRFKQFTQKSGTLFILAIDTSGSMALNRINHAKGALYELLRQSYINRDSVAIVSFKGTSGEVVLAPSSSMTRARRVLDSLTVGGGTPLSAGLVCAISLARRTASRTSGDAALLLFTDGRANVPQRAWAGEDRIHRRRTIEAELRNLGREIRKAAIDAVVVDTQSMFRSNGEAQALADNLGAQYVRVS